MALEKIPIFDEVKNWAQNQGWVTSEEAADSAPVQSVDSKTGDVTLNYADQNHSNRHENDAPDELDAGELSGASGNDGEVLATDGVAAYWKVIESGTSVDDFIRESGEFTVTLWDGTNFTQTIDLPNTFATGMATAGGYDSESNTNDAFFAVAVTGYNTDGDGNITEVVIEGSGYYDYSGRTITIAWQMFGVEA